MEMLLARLETADSGLDSSVSINNVIFAYFFIINGVSTTCDQVTAYNLRSAACLTSIPLVFAISGGIQLPLYSKLVIIHFK